MYKKVQYTLLFTVGNQHSGCIRVLVAIKNMF